MTGLDTRAIDTKELSKEKFPQVRHGFRIFISEAAFDRATERGQADLSREVGGVLVGRIHQDASGPFLRIDATIDALYAEEKGTELTFTQDTWEYIHEELEEKHQGQKIVGWYHTHPGFGIFLSDRDQFIHQSFFNLPYQIALVYDPKSREHGVFAWHDNEPTRCRQYWVGQEENTWDGPRATIDAPLAAPSGSEKEAMSKQRDERPPEGGEWDWLTFGAVGLVLLFVGGLAGFQFARYRLADEIRNEELRLNLQQGAAARDLLRLLNTELLSFVREAAVGGDAFQEPFDAGLADIDRGLAQLQSGDTQGALGPLTAGRRTLKELRDSHDQADRSLRALQRLGERSTGNPREVNRMISEQRAALGQIYSEVADDAAKAGDVQRARRLLELAARYDTGNARRYQEKRRSLLEEGSP